MRSRDARFDGWFVTAVLSTGVPDRRPSCPATTPRRRNVRFPAHGRRRPAEGFRACRRCRARRRAGHPRGGSLAVVFARAMRLIADG